VANWIRVGYCQGNFNSDNCAAGGFTLDYGPFGFVELFDPEYQPWTGGGAHFSFFNQANAAQRNFHVFCVALQPLLKSSPKHDAQLGEIHDGFPTLMQEQMENMWASKLGLETFDAVLFDELQYLMLQTSVDYTLFFRELSEIPENIEPLKKSFYKEVLEGDSLEQAWKAWLEKWKQLISTENVSAQMKRTNPKYTLREWHLVPVYQQAKQGDYTLIRELQEVMNEPYAEQSKGVEGKYYTLKPAELVDIGGISHISCSS
jgi:uncharacterized protein YdiU (UPF0061 family)